MKICFTFLLTLLFHSVVTGKTYDILAYGAEADGKTINTQAIQKAINACTPGDTVYIQTGHYLTGTVHLKSNITLYISKEGFLIGSTHINDYDAYAGQQAKHYGMLVASNANNVNITGPGTIEGSGSAFSSLPASNQPQQIALFLGCKDVAVQNLSVLNIPCNAIEFANCVNTKALNLKLWGSPATSGKGIDMYNCTNSLVNGCHIRSGNNAVSVAGLSGQIAINNCGLQSGANAISILSADSNSVKHVTVNHVNITQSGRGVYLNLSRSGSLTDMTFTDLFIETQQQHLRDSSLYGQPVYLSVTRSADSVKLGFIKNISFNNILCNSENQIALSGINESILQDIRFDDVVLDMHNTALMPPGASTTTSALNAAYVSGLHINNIGINWPVNQPQPYWGNGIAVNNFKDFRLSNYSVTTAPLGTNTHAVLLTDGSLATVDAGDVLKIRVTEPKAIKNTPKAIRKKTVPGKVIAKL